MNLLERAAVLDEKDFWRLVARHREMNASFCAEGEEDEPEVTAPDLLDEAIKRHVRRVLVKYASNVTRAAVALGILRTTLRKWL